MSYKVGISSGWWNIGRDPNLLGLATKASSFGATAGVTFNQIDLESLAEFEEPKVRQNMRRVQKELGLEIGLHAEIGRLAELESADRNVWEQSHEKLVKTVKNAVELNIKYINFHLSSATLLQTNEAQIRLQGYLSQVVTPEGKPFWTLAEKSKAVKDYLMKFTMVHRLSHVTNIIQQEPVYHEAYENERKKISEKLKKNIENALKELEKDPEFRKLPDQLKESQRNAVRKSETENANSEFEGTVHSKEFFFEVWKKCPFAKYILEAGEIEAYLLAAYSMKETGDMLWSQIAKNGDPEDTYNEEPRAFNAAVAARYLEGHLNVKDHKQNKDELEGKSVLEFIKDKSIVLTFEIPEVEGGQEALYRFYDPRHAYWFFKKLENPRVRMCIDFEHMLAQHLDPYKIIPKLPQDIGKYIYLFHLGEPKPYQGKAHIPIPLGSQAQEVLYEWLWMFRQKGFKDGILIFERGSGRSPGGNTPFQVFEQSVTALRLIAKYLDKNTKPDELPLDFYGFSEKNEAEWARQVVSVREHAYDPLEGLLSVPEEKHTLLSRSAVERQKGQEWERRKLR